MFGTMVFLAVGLVCLVVAGILAYFLRRMLRKAGLVRRTQTSRVRDVSRLAPGTPVEIKGTLRCEQPLVSEMAGKSCAYYSSRVSREYEGRDNSGPGNRSQTMSHSERFAPFYVEDASGRVLVDAQGAEVDTMEVVDRFERHTGGGVTWIGDVPVRIGKGERTLGFRYQETILPVDAPVYVLGSLKEDHSIGLSQDEQTREPFFVSYRSEEGFARSNIRKAWILGIIALGIFLFGAVFFAVGVASALGYIEIETEAALAVCDVQL